MMSKQWAWGAFVVVAVFGARLSQAAGPEIPKEIAVPAGFPPLLRVEAQGVQVYKSVEAKPGEWKWVLEGPLADLRDARGATVGRHYDGPSWEAADGSRVSRDKSEDVKSAPAPNAKADIPWLIVKLKGEEGPAGALSTAAYVQRLQTVGGLAQEEAPKRAGTRVGVPYRAVYQFYAKAP